MSKEFFWPVVAIIITPTPRVVIRKRTKRNAPAPEITPEMSDAEKQRIRTLRCMRLKRSAERVNKFTEQISLAQWQAGIDRTRVISRGGI